MGKSKILIVGATGRVGRHIAKASAAAGHPTFLLIRPENHGADRAALLEDLKNLGATILQGSLNDYSSVIAAVKQVDVVISAVSHADQQFPLVEAIKEAGNIKRFFPSEYGMDTDRATILPPIAPLGFKSQIRRATEEAGIPYTFATNTSFMSIFLEHFWHVEYKSPPRDTVEFWGDGESRVSFVAEEDVAKYVIEAVDDTRTLNKVLCIRPKLNFLSPKQVVALWEKKLGHTLEKTYCTEEDMLKKISESLDGPAIQGYSHDMLLAIRYAIFAKGGMDQPLLPHEIEADELYPHVKYRTVEECLDSLL